MPDDSGAQIVLNLTRMNRIRSIDAANLTMTVDAGCVLQNLQQAAEDAGLLFPLSLAAEGSCTIGGNLATNAGGTQVLRYGNARELCLGLEVVTAAGEVWPVPLGLAAYPAYVAAVLAGRLVVAGRVGYGAAVLAMAALALRSWRPPTAAPAPAPADVP